jgi:nitrite reductase/ring-hydroxylating ferredoxin subunit
MLVTQEPALRRYGYPVAFSRAGDPGPLRRTVLGEEVVVWRAGDSGTAHAAVDRCPHRDAKLSKGWVAGDNLVCPYHGWEFGCDGRLARVPQLDDGAPLPPKGRLGSVRCTERYGWVWVCLDDDPVGGLPEVPEWGADGWRVVPEYEWLFDCSAAHLVENNIDPAHIAFVHRESFGAGVDPRIDVPETTRTGYGMRFHAEVPVAGRPGESGTTVRVSTTDLWGPFCGVYRIAYPDGLVHIMMKACTPELDGHTRLLQQVVRNDGESDRPSADILAFDDKVEAEDQDILGGLPPDYPLAPTAQVHTRIDRPALELRRFYADILSGGWVPERSG